MAATLAIRLLLLAPLLLAAAAAGPDPVTEWTRLADQLGHGSANWRTLAIMHQAMHDAWNAALPTYQPWYPPVQGEPRASGSLPQTAMAAAAHRVLLLLNPEGVREADRLLQLALVAHGEWLAGAGRSLSRRRDRHRRRRAAQRRRLRAPPPVRERLERRKLAPDPARVRHQRHDRDASVPVRERGREPEASRRRHLAPNATGAGWTRPCASAAPTRPSARRIKPTPRPSGPTRARSAASSCSALPCSRRIRPRAASLQRRASCRC